MLIQNLGEDGRGSYLREVLNWAGGTYLIFPKSWSDRNDRFFCDICMCQTLSKSQNYPGSLEELHNITC